LWPERPKLPTERRGNRSERLVLNVLRRITRGKGLSQLPQLVTATKAKKWGALAASPLAPSQDFFAKRRKKSRKKTKGGTQSQ